MKSKTKLLQYPLKNYLLFAAVSFILGIPIYFLLIEYVWKKELDEHNRIVVDTIIHNALLMNDEDFESALKLWNTLQPHTQIQEIEKITKEKTINIYRKVEAYPHKNKKDRFQTLQKSFQKGSKFYSITTEVNMEETYDIIIILSKVALANLIILLLSFTYIHYRSSKKLLRPFYRSLELLDKVDIAKNESIRWPQTSVKEFQKLFDHLDILIEKSRSAFLQQRKFTEMASHELKTPLAILRSKLDNIVQLDNLTPEILSRLSETQRELGKLIHINKNLLILTSLGSYKLINMLKVNISRIISDLVNSSIDLMLYKNISLQHQILDKTYVLCQENLFLILLNNLWTNAGKYTPNGGIISIKLDEEKLQIINTGTDPLDKDKVFDRHSASNTKLFHKGLGLAISHEIASFHNWKLHYYFDRLQQAHIFSLFFKNYTH